MYQINSLIIFFFSSIAIGSALLIIRSKNPIHSVIFLIFTFFNITALLLVLKVEFLSLMLIIIYVGAIAILFLFVVMMLDIKITNTFLKLDYLVIGFIIGSIFLIETLYILNNIYLPYNTPTLFLQNWVLLLDNITNTETFGQVLYTYYNFFFIIAGLILLIALLGAILLTLKKRKKGTEQIYNQLSRQSFNAYFNLKKN